MCLKHNKYHIKMKFCNVQCTPKIVQKICGISFQNHPKIHSKSIPEALQNHPQKKRAKKTPKNQKKYRKWPPKGGSQGGPRTWFSHILGLLGSPGGHHGSQTSPKGPPDPSEPWFFVILGRFWGDFCAFGSIFRGFWKDFKWIFCTLFSSMVPRRPNWFPT